MVLKHNIKILYSCPADGDIVYQGRLKDITEDTAKRCVKHIPNMGYRDYSKQLDARSALSISDAYSCDYALQSIYSTGINPETEIYVVRDKVKKMKKSMKYCY